ncbi:MAG: CotH kinase family protein [Myxococcota bacterium]
MLKRARLVPVLGATLASWSCDAGLSSEAEDATATGTGSELGTAGEPTTGADSSTGGDPAGADHGDWVFDPTQLRTYSVEIAPEDLERINADPQAEEYVPAAVEVDGQRLENVAIRYKGNVGSLANCFEGGMLVCDKLSMKIRFDEYVEDQLLDGLKRLNFHSMKADPSKITERLGYALFRDFGVPASRAVHAQLVINGELMGLYALVEQVDGRFTRVNFPEDGEGNLYKEVWPMHFGEGPYLDALKTNRDESPDALDMVLFAQELQSSTPEAMDEVIDRWMDRAALARLLAVDRMVENWDGALGFWCGDWGCGNHNYYWYEETQTQRVWLIPWDLDNSFDDPNPFKEFFDQPHWSDLSADCEPRPIGDGAVGRRAATCDPIIEGLVTSMWSDYTAASHDLLDNLWTLEAIDERIDTIAGQIEPAIMADPDLGDVTEWRAEVATLRSEVLAIRAQIVAEIEG